MDAQSNSASRKEQWAEDSNEDAPDPRMWFEGTSKGARWALSVNRLNRMCHFLEKECEVQWHTGAAIGSSLMPLISCTASHCARCQRSLYDRVC